MKSLVAAAFCAALLASPSAGAFTFSDGTHADCVARGQAVHEQAAEGDAALAGFTGKTIEDAQGYSIVWNMAKLASLPPAMHDYLFFHECAHARVPTRDEITANCVGLKDMRAAGRAGAAIEARIAEFYGPGNGYWAKEPLRKPRVVATEAFRDEMHEATRSQWQAPIGERRDTADRPESPVPSGFRRNGLICVVARLANSMNYSLRRDA